MKCIHCGKEIESDSRFCTFCGGENYPAVPQPVRMPPPRKKPVGVLWIVAFAWLGAVLLGWVLTLLLMPTSGKTGPVTQQKGPQQSVSLTDGTWYQWDAGSGKLYGWQFDDNGTARYGIAGENKTYDTDYSVDSAGNIRIGFDENATVWEFDSLENCYWLYEQSDGQIYKTRIFCASSIPDGTAGCYTYRTDNGTANIQIVYENLTQMNADTVQTLLGKYNHYMMFGVCNRVEPVSREEADAILLSAGYDSDILDLYSVSRVVCCSSLAQCQAHMSHYLDSSMVNESNSLAAGAVEYNGNLYMVLAPMGYPCYYFDGEITDCGGGRWTVPLRIESEGDRFLYTATFCLQDGTIKLIALRQSDLPDITLTEDAAWELINRTDFGWMLYYFYPDGTVDETDVYTIYPHEDKTFGVDCPSVRGVDTKDDLYALLQRHFTDSYVNYYMQVSYVDDVRGEVYNGSWFEHNGTIYFAPNWGAGDQMLFRETMVIVPTGELSWTVTMEMEFTDERAQFHIVYENGSFKLDI